ncbi:hypothetical protein D3C78_1125520 [compost metagenome]
MNKRRFSRASSTNNRGRLACIGCERDRRQGRHLCARVAEGDVTEFNCSFSAFRSLRSLSVMDVRLHLQHLVNPRSGYGGSRHHHEHHRYHNKREQDLHRILDKSDQVANLHIIIADTNTAKPQNSCARKIKNKHHRRHHKGHNLVDFNRCIRQILIGRIKPIPLVAGPVE